MQRIFTNFERRHVDLWGGHPVKLRHTLHEMELFSDESLAALIETIRPERIAINTMAATGHDNRSWRYCDRGSLSGAQVLEAVKRGRIWINMNAIQEVDPRFAEMLEAMYDELHGYLPGFSSFKQKLGLLISSPGARVYYHADVPGQGLWQIKGSKRIWIYPNTEPFLKQEEMEKIVRGVSEEEITYEPWFDDYAEVHDLTPGDMLHWPLNGPHRVENLDSVNVSLTTEHWTSDIRRRFAVNYGNGVLRSQLGWTPRSQAIHGASFWPKAALALAWRKSGMEKRQSYRRKVEYQVDPAAPQGVTPIPAV
jgi:hypothetical protein